MSFHQMRKTPVLKIRKIKKSDVYNRIGLALRKLSDNEKKTT